MIVTNIFWTEFSILFAASLLGAVAVMPYGLKLLSTQARSKPFKMSLRAILLLSFLQSAVIFAVAIGIGLVAAHAIGLGAPYVEAIIAGSGSTASAGPLWLALVFGAIAGAALLVGDLLFLPYWPQQLMDTTLRTRLEDNFLASFYGGINEELLMRLFGFSVLAWILYYFSHTTTDAPTSAVLWTSNVIMTIVFGLGHLPALKKVIGEISRTMLARSLILNAPIVLLCGWLFWTYGIETAIIAHFSADIVYHVIGTVVLRRKLSGRIEI